MKRSSKNTKTAKQETLSEEERIKTKLVELRLRLGEADGPNESRFPTERFELENQILLWEQVLHDLLLQKKKKP